MSGEHEKVFLWPDNAVHLLIYLYREKKEEFPVGFKRHNILWKEITTMMEETKQNYNLLSGQQCLLGI